MSYYTVRVHLKQEVEGKGGDTKIKKVVEHYLVDAMSVTEAEIAVQNELKGYNFDYEVKGCNESKIIQVIEKTKPTT